MRRDKREKKQDGRQQEPGAFIAQLGIGVLIFIFGLQLSSNRPPRSFIYGVYWDFGDHNRFWGLLCIAVSIGFTALAIWARAKSRKKADRDATNKI
jgi:glucose uptake protein GlcU